ncbi:MAG: GNAT family N-acetyltransferase [Myxococcales bacterium]|nr:GNAT family N-acetyltransferase [Myxococcales bacterium]
MTTRLLTTADRSAVESFLRANLTRTMFLLSNLREAGIEDCEHPFAGPYVGDFAGSALVGVACHFRRGNLIVHAPADPLGLARAALMASGRSLRALVGAEEQVDVIAAALGLPAGADAQNDERDGLYRLALDGLQVPPDLGAGRVHGRVPTLADLETLVDWTVRYHVEAIGEVETPQLYAKVRAELPEAIEGGSIWLLEHDGQLVAKTAFNARLPEAVQIGGVYTPEAMRGRGYGRCVVASHLLAAREAGVELAILFTGDHNVPAQRAYAALGFTGVGRYRVLVLREPITVGAELGPAGCSHSAVRASLGRVDCACCRRRTGAS